MTNPIQFYTQEKAKLEQELMLLKKRLFNISAFRFAIFVLTIFGIYYFFGNGLTISIIAFVGFSVFAFLLFLNSKFQREKEILVSKIKINTVEIAVLNGDYKNLKTGDEFVNPNHFYSNDIDLFGIGSFFQYSNRTATEEGAKTYAKFLTENSIDFIETKQNAIKELTEKVIWRQHFSAIASLVKVEFSAKSILNYIKNYNAILPSFLTQLVKVFPLISLILIGLIKMRLKWELLVDFAWHMSQKI